MPKSYYVYVDRGGNMPQLRHSEWVSNTHPYYVRYINDRPVAYHGPQDALAQNITGDSVWCYLTDSFIPLTTLIQE